MVEPKYPLDERRRRYLAAMGITLWRRRGLDDTYGDGGQERRAAPPEADAGSSGGRTEHPAPLSAVATSDEPRVSEVAPPLRQPATCTPVPSTKAPLPLEEPRPWADEPPPWTDEDVPQSADPPSAAPLPPVDMTAAPTQLRDISALGWESLQQAVSGCRACRLCEGRTNTVFGVGNRDAELMLVGEGPGQDEDRQGEPFVGRAGKLLNKMLAAIGLTREQVYIANVVKCRPPNNRNPNPDEAAACRAFLTRQIALVRPKQLVSLGGVSATHLLGTTDAVGRLRGRIHHYRSDDGSDPVPLLVTYHPSYYLRSPAEKAKGWQDLQRIAQMLEPRKSS